MHTNSSAPLNNTALWYYLGTKHLNLGIKIIVATPGVLIEEIR